MGRSHTPPQARGAAQSSDLLLLLDGQTVTATALIRIDLPHPVPDRLGRRIATHPLEVGLQVHADPEHFDIAGLDSARHGFTSVASQVGNVTSQRIPGKPAITEETEVDGKV